MKTSQKWGVVEVTNGGCGGEKIGGHRARRNERGRKGDQWRIQRITRHGQEGTKAVCRLLGSRTAEHSKGRRLGMSTTVGESRRGQTEKISLGWHSEVAFKRVDFIEIGEEEPIVNRSVSWWQGSNVQEGGCLRTWVVSGKQTNHSMKWWKQQSPEGISVMKGTPGDWDKVKGSQASPGGGHCQARSYGAGRGRRGLDGQRLGTWTEEGGSGKERSAADTAILRGREFHPAADGLGRGPENRVLISEARPPSWPWTQLSCSYWEIQNLNNLQGPF